MKRKPFFSFLAIILSLFIFSCDVEAQTSSDWYMAGANPQRTSWTPEEIRGKLHPQWYKTFEPFIPHKIQVIAVYDRLYISTARGLYALHTGDDPTYSPGELAWFYPTELPLGHSPTVVNGVAYVGGFDKKIHAINAYTGTGIWTFDAQENNPELSAGFEVNPLVVDGTVYAGNRDGYMYAIDANTGTLEWKFKTDGPILFSAAYKDGVIYFASNDAHAYALNAQTGQEIWKSEKLLGGGFYSYWPVVTTQFDPVTQTNRDYVILGGYNEYIQGGDLWVGRLSHDLDKSGLFPNYADPNTEGDFIGALGNEPGNWAPGTVTMDASRITQYFEVNPNPDTNDPDRDILYKDWRRRYFVLNADTGIEYTYDSDGDGNPEYAPIAWFGTHSGNRYPVAVGSDGVLYQPNQYVSQVYIPKGGISGWKFGTQYISLIHQGQYGAIDEPLAVTIGGDVLHWGWFSGRAGMGAYDLTIPYDASAQPWDPDVRYWLYWETGKIFSDCPGSTVMWSGTYNLDKYTAGSNIGVYGLHGNQNAPVLYKGKLYFQLLNTVHALTTNSVSPTQLPFENSVETQESIVYPTKDQLKEELANQIQKMIDVGHLRPGYPTNGLTTFHVQPERMSFVLSYFHNPAETFYTLTRALPHLPSGLQTQTRTYLQNEYNQYGNKVHIGWNQGDQRETFITPKEIQSRMDTFNSRNSIYGSTWDYRYSLYGRWKYLEEFDNAALAQSVFNSIRNSISISPPENDYTDENSVYLPYVKNAFIAGYIGYIEIGKLAGYSETSSELRPYVTELNRLLQERANEFSAEDPYIHGTGNILNIARNFMYMTPELADYLRINAYDKVRNAVDLYEKVAPYWFVSQYDQMIGEGVTQVLFDYNAIFQAKALILGESYEELVRHVDVPGYARGDLFYIQNLVSAIEAPSSGQQPTSTPSPTPIPGDANSDGKVDGLDYVVWLNHYNTSTGSGATDGDFNADGTVDGIDYVVWLNNYGS